MKEGTIKQQNDPVNFHDTPTTETILPYTNRATEAESAPPWARNKTKQTRPKRKQQEKGSINPLNTRKKSPETTKAANINPTANQSRTNTSKRRTKAERMSKKYENAPKPTKIMSTVTLKITITTRNGPVIVPQRITKNRTSGKKKTKNNEVRNKAHHDIKLAT